VSFVIPTHAQWTTPLSAHGSKNYFAEIEQLGFAPGHMVCMPPHQVVEGASRDQTDHLPCQVEGVEPSEDPVLQARLFAYPGTFQSASRQKYG